MRRGLDPRQPLLLLIDRSKALRKAIREVFAAKTPRQPAASKEALAQTLTLQKLEFNGLPLKKPFLDKPHRELFSRSGQWCCRVKNGTLPGCFAGKLPQTSCTPKRVANRIRGYRPLHRLVSTLPKNMKSNHKSAA